MNKITGLMVLGTASDVGKSFLVAAICRLFANEGYSVTPFKSQNMTGSVSVLEDGSEVGKSLHYQALAAKINPTVEMNPILLKPVNGRVEVSVLGKMVEQISGHHFRNTFYEQGLQAIETSLLELANEYEVIVLEGAGSPVELNLKERELVNMKVAELADVPAILVADIDRGGVFATVVGTIALLSESERARVKGIIINKFRGDVDLFMDGVRILEEKTGIPVLGVIPSLDQPSEREDRFDDQAAHVKAHLDWNELKKIIFQWSDA